MTNRALAYTIAAIVTAAAVCFGPPEAYAQEPGASLEGRVTDAAGQGLAGIEVAAQSSSLIVAVTTRTTASGHYSFAALPAGIYVVSFSRAGLVPVKRMMRLAPAQAATSHVIMRAERQGEEAITVTGDRLVFPPSWTTSLLSRYSTLEILPVTGTPRSAVGLTTELAGARPDLSLFTVDGLRLRNGWLAPSGASFSGPGPETLREISITPGRLPAGYGSLQAGAIEVVTSPGGSRRAGSFRGAFGGADANADLIREARKTDGLSGSAEYTIGGALLADRAWYFASGRHLTQSLEDHTALVGEPFVTTSREHMGLAKITFAANAHHRLEAQWIGARLDFEDAAPGGGVRAGDALALDDRVASDRALSAAYFGRPLDWLDVSARYTRESGSLRQERTGLASDPAGVALVDQQSGTVWRSPGGCASCDPATAVHDQLRLTGGTAVSGGFGLHRVTVGYDFGRHALEPAGVPGGGLFEIRATRADAAGGTVYPVALPGGSTWIVWRPEGDRRTSLHSHSFFVNDRWMPADRLTLDVGVRFDRRTAALTAGGQAFLKEHAWSPRLFATWRPRDVLPWTITAGFGRFVADVTDRAFDASLLLQPPARAFVYDGPAINASGQSVGSDEAVTRILDWFSTQGGVSASPSLVIAGATPLADATAKPLRVDEWSFGVGRTLGEDGHARADLTFRSYGNFSGRRIDRSMTTIDPFGRAVDTVRFASADLFERSYTGLTLTARYRFGHYADLTSQYTWSRLEGNATDSTPAMGTFAGTELAYPEYFDPSWRLPAGSLPDDAPHRLRFWGHSELMANDKHGLLIASLVYSRESGRPYGAAGLVGVSPYVANPGYRQPPVAVLYHFTARDAFRTDPISRIDIGLSYRRRLPGSVHGDLFAQFDILNATGSVRVFHPERLVVTRTAFTDPTLQPFNPFLTTPVQGVHWTLDDLDVSRDTARAGVPTTLPRTFRLTIGIRF